MEDKRFARLFGIDIPQRRSLFPMRGKFFSFRDGLQLPALWRWLLTLAGCLLTGLGLALACRLIDSQSLRQTLASLAQGSLWLTALFLALACAVLTLLTHSLFAGSLIAALASVLLTFVNYFKVLITSVPLSLGDFSLIGQVGDIASLNASAITFGRNSILAVAAVVVWLAVVWFFSKPLRIEWRWSLVGAAGGALVFALVFWLGADRLVYTPLGVGMDRALSQTAVNEACGGPILGLWRSLFQQTNRDLGEDYSQEHMEDVVTQVEEYAAGQPASSGAQQPNIILILSESFFDITPLPGVTFDEDPVADFHALQEESVSGAFHTRSLGYGTCNIELEIFTGMNTGVLSGEDLYSWDPDVFSRLPSVVSLLGDAGYYTGMLHMFNDTIYHRTGFFTQLGFDDLYFSEDLAEFYAPAAQADDYWTYMNSRIEGSYYSDDLMSDALIALYEQKIAQTDSPVFLYGISMENHSTYVDKYAEDELTVDPQSSLTGEAANDLLHLSQGISNASAALGKLVDYFRTVDEPTIIVFYGDHRPGLGLTDGGTVYSELGMVSAARSEWSVEQLSELYSTDYLIWANDPELLPGEPGSTMDTSCNYLGTILLDLAGVEKPLYWRFLSQLSETRLCDTTEYHLGRDGILSALRPSEGQDALGLDLLADLLNDTIYGRQYVTQQIG